MGTFLSPAEVVEGTLAGWAVRWARPVARPVLAPERSVPAALARGGTPCAARTGGAAIAASSAAFSRCSVTLLAGVGRSISSLGRAMDAASRGGPNAREIWLSAVLVGALAGNAIDDAGLGASDRGMLELLGIGRTGLSVLAINPAAAQARTIGSQM